MILLHINDKTKRQQIVSLCHSLNHQIKQFDESDAGRTVGELVGIKGVKGTKSEYSADGDNAKLPDCIIFSDVSSQAMDVFLAEYKIGRASCRERV